MTFNNVLKDIKSLKIQGAENVAKEAVKAIKNEVLKTKIITPSKLISDLKEKQKKLVALRPTEPCMRNALNFVFNNISKSNDLLNIGILFLSFFSLYPVFFPGYLIIPFYFFFLLYFRSKLITFSFLIFFIPVFLSEFAFTSIDSPYSLLNIEPNAILIFIGFTALVSIYLLII